MLAISFLGWLATRLHYTLASSQPSVAFSALAFVKAPEVQYQHDVYNQFPWNLF
jgi:hypothetical protein